MVKYTQKHNTVIKISDFYLPASANSFKRSGHSSLNKFAPVREPSPPITTKLVIPRVTKFFAAVLRPARSLNSLQRADPITVPP